MKLKKKEKPTSLNKTKSLVTSSAFKEVNHAEQFQDMLTILCDSGIGAYLVRTREIIRAQRCLRDWSVMQGFQFVSWNTLRFWENYKEIPSAELLAEMDTTDIDFYEIEGRDSKFKTPYQVIDEATRIASQSKRICVTLQTIPEMLRAPETIQAVRELVWTAMERDVRVFFLTNESAEVPIDMENDIQILDFKPPSYAERLDSFNTLVDTLQSDSDNRDLAVFIEEDCGVSPDEVSIIVNNGAGMTMNDFDNACSMALVRHRDKMIGKNACGLDLKDFLDEISITKTEAVKRTKCMEVIEPEKMSNVGGLDLLKEYIADRRNAFSDEAREFGVDKPKGVIILGPPGVGKSLIAKAIAGVLGLPCIRFDLSAVFGKWVGQSESQMRTALSHAEDMAPCVLFIDEIDKSLSGSQGGAADSGTTERVFGTFLTWIQERQNSDSPVYVVASANNIRGMPPELFRKGRFDEIFSVGLPSLQERLEIFAIHLIKRGHRGTFTEDQITEACKLCDGFVGSEIEVTVSNTILTCFNKGMKKLSLNVLKKEIDKIVPLSVSFKEEVQAMADWAKENAVPASSREVSGKAVANKRTAGKSDSKKPRRSIKAGPAASD